MERKTHYSLYLAIIAPCKARIDLKFYLTYQARPFQSFARPGEGLRGPDTNNQGYHQPIEMKVCVSSHESMPDTEFESDSFSCFGDMKSQNFSLKRRTSHKIQIFMTFIPGKWI